MAIMAVVAK